MMRDTNGLALCARKHRHLGIVDGIVPWLVCLGRLWSGGRVFSFIMQRYPHSHHTGVPEDDEEFFDFLSLFLFFSLFRFILGLSFSSWKIFPLIVALDGVIYTLTWTDRIVIHLGGCVLAFLFLSSFISI
ncbi:hypothetical protein F5X96DRAFT_451781 [Biscogniauxia mediterranea]|nr:hypothetical protein F5X96DRAFT_451781 [Biscogniauxia mediterranea]